MGRAVDIVYGGSLEALRFAKQHNAKIILENCDPPAVYESRQVQEEWASLIVELMLEGKVCGGDDVVGAHIHDEHIKVVSGSNIVNTIRYNNIYFFSDKKVFGLPAPSRLGERYQVIDHLQQVSLSLPHTCHICTRDDFARDIYLVKEGLRRKTQLYVVSYMTKKNLHSFDFSDTMVRFKCEDLLRQNGFTGSANGKHKRLLKLETRERTVIEPMHHYASTDRLKFCYGN
jgi:hypothetical protein